MTQALIVTKTDLFLGKSTYNDYEIVIKLDEKDWDLNDILCFVPNRIIQGNGNMSIGFIPYSQRSWDYKNNARAIRYKLGNDNCLIIDTDITYKFHKKINLPFTEEVHILLLTIEFLLLENILPIITHKIDIGENQNEYLEELIKENKIKILNE